MMFDFDDDTVDDGCVVEIEVVVEFGGETAMVDGM